jgi:hypothetical protein
MPTEKSNIPTPIIEEFLNQVRIADQTGVQEVRLPKQKARQLADAIAIVMTKLAAKLDQTVQSSKSVPQDIEVDGGGFDS